MKFFSALLNSVLIFPPLFIIIFSGCNRDEIINSNGNSDGIARIGVYVLCEGNSSPNDSKLGFYSPIQNEYTQNITFPNNLGIFASDIIEYNSFIYATQQGSPGTNGKVTKLDSTGLLYASPTIGLNPYSLAAVNGKLYCTNSPDSSVSVVNLSSMNEIKKIRVGRFPSDIATIGSKVFVCNTRPNSGLTDRTISVINSNLDTVESKFTINGTPCTVAATKDGTLLVGTTDRGGIIYRLSIDDYDVLDSFAVTSGIISEISLDYNSDDIYFISGARTISKLNLVSKEKTNVIQGTSAMNFYGYSFDTNNRKHYVTDAVDFASNGYLLIYNSSGVSMSSFQTGIRPRRVLVRN